VCVDEFAAGVGERVEDDLALASGRGKPGGAQRAEVVADEVLCSPSALARSAAASTAWA
jgi:hypothetical protein